MDNAVTIINQSSLRPGQMKLYELIVQKLDNEDKITIDEARQIWLSRVHSNKREDGTPLRYDYYAERHETPDGQVTYSSELVPMTEDEITERVLMWLTSNIGILVIRGYLKVIPMIDLKELKLIESKEQPK